MSPANATTTISHISVVAVHVKNQDEALRFYTETLGFEKRSDAMMGPEMRWLTVAPVGSPTEISLSSTMDAGAPLGGNSGLVFETADIDAMHRDLTARGVTFTLAPIRESFGGWAEFTDQDGNRFGLHSNQFGA